MQVDAGQALEHVRPSMTTVVRLRDFDNLRDSTLELIRSDLEMLTAAIDSELERRRGATMDTA